MFNFPNQIRMLDLMLEFKNSLEEQNEVNNHEETENKQFKKFDNLINENSYLKENKKNNPSNPQKIELKNLSNFIKKSVSERKKEASISDKNKKREDNQKRKAIAEYFNDKRDIDYFQILQNFERNENYLKYKILFDALKLNYDKMRLSRTDMAKYLFDCTSYEIENNRDIEKFEKKKKLLLFHVAKQKLKIDFDIVNILKTIDQFNDFKEIIMDDDQSTLFEFAIKKISNKKIDKKNNDQNLDKAQNEKGNERKKDNSNIFFANNKIQEYEEKMNIIQQTEEGLDEIFKEYMENGPSSKHVNLLRCIGINQDLIKEFEEMNYSFNGKILSNFLFLQ